MEMLQNQLMLPAVSEQVVKIDHINSIICVRKSYMLPFC